MEAFLRSGREAAFLEIYDRHTPALYQFALRLLAGSTRDAEDAVQEAWLRAMQRLGGFGWRSSLRTWLNGFVLNCAREILRGRARATSATDGRAVGAGPPSRDGSGRARAHTEAADAARVPGVRPDDRLLEAMDLERALARLPDDMRLALILHDVYGHTHEEIASLLGVSPGTSKSRTSRGRERMRALLRLGPDAPTDAPSEPPAEGEQPV